MTFRVMCLFKNVFLDCFNAEKAQFKEVGPSYYCRILSHSRRAAENLFTESVHQGVTKQNLADDLRNLGFTISQTNKKTEK